MRCFWRGLNYGQARCRTREYQCGRINTGGISFGYFHRNLSRRGHWINHPRWGDVWLPPNARHYRPYYNGHFVYTDFGLLWVRQ